MGQQIQKFKLKVQGEVNFMDSVRLKKGLALLMNMYLAPLRAGTDADALAMNIAGLQLWHVWSPCSSIPLALSTEQGDSKNSNGKLSSSMAQSWSPVGRRDSVS